MSSKQELEWASVMRDKIKSNQFGNSELNMLTDLSSRIADGTMYGELSPETRKCLIIAIGLVGTAASLDAQDIVGKAIQDITQDIIVAAIANIVKERIE
jgi:hypothetical protein